MMVVCVICKINQGTLKITDGNPKYKGKPIKLASVKQTVL